jgi:hypothetical protein
MNSRNILNDIILKILNTTLDIKSIKIFNYICILRINKLLNK